MAICFLAFLFFGFILVNYLGKNMEGYARENPGRLTKCYSEGTGYAWDYNGERLQCNDNNKNPNPGEIHSCNNVTRNKYVCKNAGYKATGKSGTGFSNDRRNLSYYQWTKK